VDHRRQGELRRRDDVFDRAGNERSSESFSDSGLSGSVKLSEVVCDSEDRREDSFKKQCHSSQLSQYGSPSSMKDSGLIEDFELFFQGTIGAL
jgi:hypothetical protein